MVTETLSSVGQFGPEPFVNDLSPDDRDHSDDQQQELFILVTSRLVAVQDGRLEICRRSGAGRRSDKPRRIVAAVTLDPGAVPEAPGHPDLGYSGDRRISHEVRPKAGLLPPDRAARARCRSICG